MNKVKLRDEIKIKLHEGALKPVIRNGNMCDLGIWQYQVLNNNDYNNKSINLDDIVWYDRECCSDYIEVRQGDVLCIDTGVAIEMPEGWFNYCVPRSSDFLKYGIILTNSIGVIDHSYKGNNDTWKGFFLCTRSAKIPIDTLLLQFQPVKDTLHQFEFKFVDSLDNEDRGGYGSTDLKGVTFE